MPAYSKYVESIHSGNQELIDFVLNNSEHESIEAFNNIINEFNGKLKQIKSQVDQVKDTFEGIPRDSVKKQIEDAVNEACDKADCFFGDGIKK